MLSLFIHRDAAHHLTGRNIRANRPYSSKVYEILLNICSCCGIINMVKFYAVRNKVSCYCKPEA